MIAQMLKSSRLSNLFSDVESNLERYRSGDFEDIIDLDTDTIALGFDVTEQYLKQMRPSSSNEDEPHNAILLFEAFKNLNLYLARDARLWTLLTHTQLLEYSRARWPIPDDDAQAVKHIRNHFFVQGARGIDRNNAASRLWWMAFLCARVDDAKLLHYLRVLLFKSDVRANIIERPSMSQHFPIFKAILEELSESFNSDRALFERIRFRQSMKRLNVHGGLRLIEQYHDEAARSLIASSFSADV